MSENNDFDNVMSIFQKGKEASDNTELQDIKNEIAKLQEEIAKLKAENQTLKDNQVEEEAKDNDVMKNYRDELDEAIKPIAALFEKVFAEKKDEIVGISTCISRAQLLDRSGTHANTACIHDIDSVNEEGIAAACEVFTNPRRIAVLKVLFKESLLTASEIGQRTGLVGGQLYHHLSALEAAELIRKVGDKYETDSAVLGLLCAIEATVGGMKIAKPEDEYPSEGYNPELCEIKFEDFELSLQKCELKLKNKVYCDVPPRELELLYYMANNANKVFTRDQLLDKVWGYDYTGDSRTVDVHIKRLQSRLNGVSDKWELKTVWGVGYKFILTQ